MMNVLQIAQAAYGEIGLPQPSQIAGGNTADGPQILALLNREGNELARVDGGWPVLRGEQLVTLVPGQQAYDFPADILYYRPATGWDRSTHWRLAGPISDREWQALRSGIIVASPRLRFRLYGGQLQIDPVPSSADTLAFEYISKNWAVSAAGTRQASFLADTDTPLLPDDLFVLGLKWRLLAARGFNYAEEKDAYVKARDATLAQRQMSDALDLGRRLPRVGGLGLPQIPEGNFPSS
jgi:hypothetical protein